MKFVTAFDCYKMAKHLSEILTTSPFSFLDTYDWLQELGDMAYQKESEKTWVPEKKRYMWSDKIYDLFGEFEDRFFEELEAERKALETEAF